MVKNNFFEFPVYRIPNDSRPIESPAKLVIIGRDNAMTDENLSLLEKILSAINRKLNDCTLIRLKEEESILLTHCVSPSFDTDFLLFGVHPADLGLQIDRSYYQFNRLANWSILRSHDLPMLASNIKAKKALWASIKQAYLKPGS